MSFKDVVLEWVKLSDPFAVRVTVCVADGGESFDTDNGSSEYFNCTIYYEQTTGAETSIWLTSEQAASLWNYCVTGLAVKTEPLAASDLRPEPSGSA